MPGLIKPEVADDAKNSRALGDIGERKSKPNRLQRTSRLWFKDGCICEESPELIRTEREREEAKSHTAHTVKHSFHRHLLSFLTDDDAITNLLPSLDYIPGSQFYKVEAIVRGTVRFFPQGPSSCEVELTFAYEVPLLLVPFATALQPLMQGMIKDSLELFAEIAKTTKTT
ncbi:PREDICTED: uncharacterized protein LOC106319039 [Brassica oleracea var. oleracea]|nr:PREDICTED: uncharacterized protein LOC106319039 [Brassica oleracea var. oleracea]